jgi:hypothetical protein
VYFGESNLWSDFGAKSGASLGGAGGSGGAALNLQILQELDKESNTACSPCGVRRIYRLRPCRRPPLLLQAAVLAGWHIADIQLEYWLAGWLAGLQSAICKPQSAICNRQFATGFSNSQFTIRNPQFASRNSQFPFGNLQFAIHNSVIHNS